MTATAAGDRNRRRILIADDSELNRELLTEMLGDGYDYLYAQDGEELLDMLGNDVQADILLLAHEICRHHHERYDGKGYPDGLSGDEIPLSAQAVSLADVYDALTSDRCYKTAYSHEEAMAMILGGQCGAFNPLLLQCLVRASDELLVALRLNELDPDYIDSVRDLAEEALEEEDLPTTDRTTSLTECERAKKNFFARQSGGIQFEYDAVARKVLSITYYDRDGDRLRLSNLATQLLSPEDWSLLQEKVRHTTREQPTVTMEALVPLETGSRWFRVTAESIWAEDSETYVAIVGQFTDIHDELVRRGKELLVNDVRVTGAEFLTMSGIFDVVRLVDPRTCQVLHIQPDGSIAPDRQKCYEVWNRCERCKNCTSVKALHDRDWLTKLEVRDGRIYSVLSRYARFGDMDCVLEVALCMEDTPQRRSEEVGFLPDRSDHADKHIEAQKNCSAA